MYFKSGPAKLSPQRDGHGDSKQHFCLNFRGGRKGGGCKADYKGKLNTWAYVSHKHAFKVREVRVLPDHSDEHVFPHEFVLKIKLIF